MKCNVLMLLTAVSLCASTGSLRGETNSFGRGFDLTKLQVCYTTNAMSGDAKMALLIEYLRGELGIPSSPRMGPGGGPIDTLYVQDVILSVMAQTVPQESMLKVYTHEPDRMITSRIMLALAAAGHSGVSNELYSSLQNQKDPLFLLAGARGLAKARDKDAAKSLLEGMRLNTYSRVAVRTGHYYKVYPIREAAHQAIAKLGFKAGDWERDVPLDASTENEALGTLFQDEDPGQCANVLQILGKRHEDEARAIVERFVVQKANDPRLAKVVEEGRQILRESK